MSENYAISAPTGAEQSIIAHNIASSLAWTRRELAQNDFSVTLSPAAQQELLGVADALGPHPADITRLHPEQYPMPHCAAAMGEVRHMLHGGVGFALVSRLPVEHLSLQQSKALYWLLSSMVARPVAQKLDGTMVYDVLDTGAKALPGSGVRPDKTNIDLTFHNDNAYNALMPEVVGLLCVRPAQEGGRSRVMSFATAHNALLERFPDVLPRLYQPFWFDRQREHEPHEPLVFQAPVFTRHDGTVAARLALHQIRSGYAMQNLDMDAATAAALRAVESVFSDDALQFDFTMTAGEIQFAANREIGHSRTTFIDFPEPEKRRLLVRLWLRDDGAPTYTGA